MILLLAAFAVLDPGIDVRTEFAYDNNIYEYSAADLDTFMAGTRPERFPIEAADDLTVSFRLNLWFRARIIRRRTTTLRLQAETVNQAVNHPKDNQTYGIALRQSFGPWAVMADYRYQPRLMLRYYPPPGGGGYLACTYTRHHAGLTVAAALSRAVSARMTAGRETETYRAEFSPYDSRIWRAGGALTFAGPGQVEPTIEYGFKHSRAAGPVPDLSHDQHAVQLAVAIPVPPVRAAALRVEYQFVHRSYTTELSPDQDTPHAGRTDAIQRWQAGLRFPLNKHIDLDPSFTYEYRRSSSDAYPVIGLKKDYDAVRAACGLRLYH